MARWRPTAGHGPGDDPVDGGDALNIPFGRSGDDFFAEPPPVATTGESPSPPQPPPPAFGDEAAAGRYRNEPAPLVPSATPTVHPPAAIPPPRPLTRDPNSKFKIAPVVGIAVVAAVVALWAVFSGASRDSHPSTHDASGLGPSPSNGGFAASMPPSMTFESMRDSASEYYGLLPGRPTQAWDMLETGFQARTGRQNFFDFFAAIRSIDVLSVNPRDGSSVVLKLRYVTTTGTVDTENRWLGFAVVGDKLQIADSQRMGEA